MAAVAPYDDGDNDHDGGNGDGDTNCDDGDDDDNLLRQRRGRWRPTVCNLAQFSWLAVQCIVLP